MTDDNDEVKKVEAGLSIDDAAQEGVEKPAVAKPKRLTSCGALAAVACSCMACAGPKMDTDALFFDVVLSWGGISPQGVIAADMKLKRRLHRVLYPRAAEEFATIDDIELRAEALASSRLDPTCAKFRVLVDEVLEVEHWGRIVKANFDQPFAYDDEAEKPSPRRSKSAARAATPKSSTTLQIRRKPTLSRFTRSTIVVTQRPRTFH